MNRPTHFHINRTSVSRLVERNQLNFSSIEMNKALLTPVHGVSQIRFKFRSQFKLLPQIRCLISLRIESNIISIDTNITITPSPLHKQSQRHIFVFLKPNDTNVATTRLYDHLVLSHEIKQQRHLEKQLLQSRSYVYVQRGNPSDGKYLQK